MNIEELLIALDIEEAEDFQFFENFADLIECDDDIPADTLFELLSRLEMKDFSELMDNYFDEILEALPEDATEVSTLLNTIKMSLSGMANNIEEDHDLVLFAEELIKFRTWYNFESEATCTNKEKGREVVISLRDAILLYRQEKLGEDEYEYDFDGCLNYELDEYVVSFSDLAALDSDEDEDYEGELEDGYVYDDEFDPDEN